MKPGVPFLKTRFFIFLLALALPALALPPSLRAQAGAPGQSNSFDYIPADGEKITEAPRATVQINLNDIEVISHPGRGVYFVSKHRWKDWVERALYLVLLNIALIALTASMPKNDERNLIISYFLTGVSYTFAFWIFLCAILLFKLKSASGIYVLPVSAALAAATYYLMMRIRKADISLTDLKEAFKQQSGSDGSDQRLSSVDGSPGNWPEQDFLK